MDEQGDQQGDEVLSFLNKQWFDTYYDISDFKKNLNDVKLAHEASENGWVLWRANERKQQSNNTSQLEESIKDLFRYITHTNAIGFHCMVQFWGVDKVEDRHHQLSTADQPFCVAYLDKEFCWYRKRCKTHVYHYVEERAEEAQLGGVGRAYRTKHPESTPDLLLYSTNEFPLRDHAARSGFKGYLALPVFGLHNNKCNGVLELLSGLPVMEPNLLSSLYQGLQIVGLRSRHTNFCSIIRGTMAMQMPDKYKHQPTSEITETLELAIKEIPTLHLAQVWIPCKQCAYMSTNLCCMERASFINARDKKVNSCQYVDEDIFAYIQASEFHNLQIDLSCFPKNSCSLSICNLSISKNPLAHYVGRARLSSFFAVYLKSMHSNNDAHLIEFFLQPNGRRDVCGDSSLHSFQRILKKKLNFELQFGGQLPIELRMPDSIESESFDMLDVRDSCGETFFESTFTNYLEMIDLRGIRLSYEGSENGWVFCRPTREELSVHEGKIKHLMEEIAVKVRTNPYCMVQFWEPKKVDGRCYLETLHQPFVVGCLAKGLASFRKKCMKHQYFVDDESKEEELGPPGRVFRSGHPEMTPDPFLYTTKEFWIRNHAVDCCFREYFVLPVFDENKQCVGVLEFIGFSYDDREYTSEALKVTELRSTHIDAPPRFLRIEKPDYDMFNSEQIIQRREALDEIRYFFYMIKKNVAQIHLANVWVPYGECDGITGKLHCMELALSTNSMSTFMPTDQVHWIHVQKERGIIGWLLASETKSCFCRNLCEFSIADQPLVHYERRERHDQCFAICLQSSHTGETLYVLEFFLYQGPATYEYLKSFLNFLLPIMKEKLKTFKVASGKQLGEELVVEVIEFSEDDKFGSTESELENVLPFKFRSVYYGRKELEYTEKETEECSVADYDFKKTEKEKRKRKRNKKADDLNISHEDLKQHFGKKLKDVAAALGVSKSTIKRRCREFGIMKWPCNEKQAGNPSLYERESINPDPQQDIWPSSSSTLQLSKTSLNRTIVPHTHMESSQRWEEAESSQHWEEAEKVMIKVKCQEDTIKFEACLTSGVSKIFEEVATRLNLEVGAFKLKYVDEENDEILFAHDSDLKLCPRRPTANGATCIQLLVRLIPK